MFNRTMSILEESKETWPLASRWLEGLRKFSGDARAGIATEGTMADGVSIDVTDVSSFPNTS